MYENVFIGNLMFEMGYGVRDKLARNVKDDFNILPVLAQQCPLDAKLGDLFISGTNHPLLYEFKRPRHSGKFRLYKDIKLAKAIREELRARFGDASNKMRNQFQHAASLMHKFYTMDQHASDLAGEYDFLRLAALELKEPAPKYPQSVEYALPYRAKRTVSYVQLADEIVTHFIPKEGKFPSDPEIFQSYIEMLKKISVDSDTEGSSGKTKNIDTGGILYGTVNNKTHRGFVAIAVADVTTLDFDATLQVTMSEQAAIFNKRIEVPNDPTPTPNPSQQVIKKKPPGLGGYGSG